MKISDLRPSRATTAYSTVSNSAATASSPSGAPRFVPDGVAISFDRRRLADHLHRAGIDFDPEQPIRQFAGGLANRNYLVEIDGQLAVLRRPPSGVLPPGAHDMAREHRILSRLANAVPFVPRAIHFCEDASIIGAQFQLIEYRAGLVIRGADLSELGDSPTVPARLCEMLIGLMATLHATDAAAIGLGELGRPEGFIERNINNWTRRGLQIANGLAVRHVIEEIRRWLDAQRFETRTPTILHCDFKLDNVVIDPSTLTPCAVVDWDMGTRGDPLFDLATLLSYWSEARDPECLRTLDQMPTTLPGFWSRDIAARRYEALTGRSIDDLHAMRVLAMLKLGVVFLQLHRQWVEGAVGDPRYQPFADRGESLLLHARDIAKGAAQ